MAEDIYAETVATLGDRLTAAREAAGLSIGDLAADLGIRPETQHGWEIDQAEPAADLLGQIAARLDVSVDWLLTGHGEAPHEMAERARLAEELRALQALLTEATVRLARLQKVVENG